MDTHRIWNAVGSSMLMYSTIFDREQEYVNLPASSLDKPVVISTSLREAEASPTSGFRDSTCRGAQGEGSCYQGPVLSSRALFPFDE